MLFYLLPVSSLGACFIPNVVFEESLGTAERFTDRMILYGGPEFPYWADVMACRF
jgi:hypothetical protein